MERLGCKDETSVLESEENILQLRHWVSLRGQTLFRTGNLYHPRLYIFCIWFNLLTPFLYPAVRGMMYYRRALKLQAFLDMATETGEA